MYCISCYGQLAVALKHRVQQEVLYVCYCMYTVHVWSLYFPGHCMVSHEFGQWMHVQGTVKKCTVFPRALGGFPWVWPCSENMSRALWKMYCISQGTGWFPMSLAMSEKMHCMVFMKVCGLYHENTCINLRSEHSCNAKTSHATISYTTETIFMHTSMQLGKPLITNYWQFLPLPATLYCTHC